MSSSRATTLEDNNSKSRTCGSLSACGAQCTVVPISQRCVGTSLQELWVAQTLALKFMALSSRAKGTCSIHRNPADKVLSADEDTFHFARSRIESLTRHGTEEFRSEVGSTSGETFAF